MFFKASIQAVAITTLLTSVQGAPITGADIANSTYGPIPGEDSSFSNNKSKAAPFPANYKAAVLPTTNGTIGADDILFQNLLSAEWVIYSFYQAAVEAFNETSFTSAGFLNTTYERITSIRDNEAGHLRIFQDSISSSSVKPGPCTYTFPFEDPTTFLALQTLIEISSMAFLTGLVQQANLNFSKGALLAIAETESRHNTWSLIDVWNTDPFGGPSDTVFPYANEVLDVTHQFIVPGSCPAENPQYPFPSQGLPALSTAKTTTSVTPGSQITWNFTNPDNQPSFETGKDYWTVYFHGVLNVSVPFDTKTYESTIPDFEEKGVILAVIADVEGAPYLESVVAGPSILLEQPANLGLLFS